MTTRPDLVRSQRVVKGRVRRPLKLVITGPFNAGKTTLIRTISEVAVVGTDRDVSDETRDIKRKTTVAMDFGRLSFASDLALFLFGTPGQRRFEVMWEILSEGMIGFILLVHAGDQRSVEEAAHILETFCAYADVPFVIGVTHLDEVDEPHEQVFERIRERLGLAEDARMVGCDPRRKEDIKSLMLQILVEVRDRLDQAEAVAG
jgi:signal recognition particle receptor subunit beta